MANSPDKRTALARAGGRKLDVMQSKWKLKLCNVIHGIQFKDKMGKTKQNKTKQNKQSQSLSLWNLNIQLKDMGKTKQNKTKQNKTKQTKSIIIIMESQHIYR
jgi:hypothetical protein